MNPKWCVSLPSLTEYQNPNVKYKEKDNNRKTLIHDTAYRVQNFYISSISNPP
jgi:hypothetical protein